MKPDPQLMRFAHELWADLHDANVIWQLATLALCLGLGYWLARVLRPHLSERVQAHQDDLTRRGASFAQHMHLVGGGFNRILYPLLALIFVLIGRAVLEQFHHVTVLNLAVPLLTAFAAIRALVYLLRHVFAPSGALAAGERWLAIAVWVGVVLHFTGLAPELIGALERIAFHMGRQRISLWLIGQAALSVSLTLLVSFWLAAVIEGRLMAAESLDLSLRVVLGRFVKALLVLAAVLTSLGLVGIDLTVLSVFGGALGVGLGLGLQRIASNYLSGFIILLDRSIRIGDMITVDKYSGAVTHINTRYTVLKALDGTEAIVPNETLVNTPVQNLSFTTRENRLAIQITVAYDSDLEQVKRILLAAAAAHTRILDDPAPVVYLIRFGADGLELEMGFWIRDPERGSLNVRSELNFAIWGEFKLHNVSVPFPQREIRMLDASK
jgi:small-conductance mechanosensitive channel